MSIKYSNTTADYIQWDTMLSLVRKLYKDKKYRLSLLIGCGCFFGLRISDLKTLTWNQLLSGSKFSLIEKKTGKRREVKINEGFQKHILDCYNALKVEDMTEHCFLNNRGEVISTQMINRHLKTIKVKYNVKVEHLSSHSFRKTFGRKVVESAGEQSEMALIKLSEIFNHASPMITRRYLGLRAEELEEVYNVLEF
ncbi:MAG: tyrosine-type recombinase/integrase [Alistipes sp.]|nr:tyrosine-type recombinase/integrase [Alistipes sp.]